MNVRVYPGGTTEQLPEIECDCNCASELARLLLANTGLRSERDSNSVQLTDAKCEVRELNWKIDELKARISDLEEDSYD